MAMLSPPGSIDDFERRPHLRDDFAEAWDLWLRYEIDAATDDHPGRFGLPLLGADKPEPRAIAWDAFPRLLKRWYEPDPQPDEARWRVAEILRPEPIGVTDAGEQVVVLRRQQDEYCEWFVHRDADDRIDRIDFTCEGPEYWHFLAHGTTVLFRGRRKPPPSSSFTGDLTLVLELYREYVSDAVELKDLLWETDVIGSFEDETVGVIHKKGEYNPFNMWNTTHGAMHLTHRANTLGAELVLGADGTVVHARNGQPVTDVDALICCARFGDPNRSSDPIIGAGVNRIARQGFEVALADPIGLYIMEINEDAFFGPDGWQFSDAWAKPRGSGQRTLRTSFMGSMDGSVKIDQIASHGRPIEFGGQVADAIQMVLFGEAHGPVKSVVEQPCVSDCCTHPAGRPVVGFPVVAGDCTTVQWGRIAPDDGEGQPEAMALEEARVLVGTVSSARTRAG
jgi:hypothetical protein